MLLIGAHTRRIISFNVRSQNLDGLGNVSRQISIKSNKYIPQLSTNNASHITTSYGNHIDEKDNFKTDYTNIMVFKDKNIKELVRSWFVLKSSSIDLFVKNSEKLFIIGHKILGKTLFQKIMSLTYYTHFTIGSNVEENFVEIEKLKKRGIRPMLMVPTETNKHKSEQEAEQEYARNFEIMKDSAKSGAIVDPNGFVQYKMTPICDKELLLEMNKFLIDFETNHEEPGDWDIKRVIDFMKNNEFEKINMADLSAEQNQKLQKFLQRMDELCQLCKDLNVRLMLDAEQTYLQAALGYITLLLQGKHNQEKIVVHNTYQCYRKDTLKRIIADYQLGKKYGFHIAGKLVRGAYMVEERALAEKNGKESPINENIDKTKSMYHSVVDYLMPHIVNQDVSIMVATHNEETVDFIIERMSKFNVSKSSQYLCFGQIYGLCDHVSYLLGEKGYQTFKSTPYGSMDDTLLYLSRRAHENRSVLERTKLERFLIRKEVKRRIGSLFYPTTN